MKVKVPQKKELIFRQKFHSIFSVAFYIFFLFFAIHLVVTRNVYSLIGGLFAGVMWIATEIWLGQCDQMLDTRHEFQKLKSEFHFIEGDDEEEENHRVLPRSSGLRR